MKIIILADIHANYDALQSVIADIKGNGVAGIYSLGDNIGYGPEPEKVIQTLQEYGITSIMGNHEYALIKPDYRRRLNATAKESLAINLQRMSDEDIAYAKGLPLVSVQNEARLVHGCPPKSAVAYLFDPSPRMLGKIFQSFAERIAFYGHTHAFDLVESDGGKSHKKEVALGTYHLNPRCRYLINPGSVGQPRDGINNQAKYLLWDLENDTVTFKSVPYDVRGVIKKIKNLELPEFNWERLLEW